ncbi:LysM peptidoglycan-binding domain-containing protein [Paenibacillus sp. DMB20]|uniref:LysM peptidoglycan-binding domain-containing protein n=1 Tax=Paenibacillus sp. DMB20 TaxID=1642570 RepID=UPI00062786F6|nr:hypothetical protein XI25_26955 [Paenibacillus sp. DMB20]KKO51881.1 hypothetical protein XI25_23280 [Paenibacillus sp. DMB20]
MPRDPPRIVYAKKEDIPVFDQSYGLRFDIYERIILAEDLPGIEELEEAELIPHIQVISQEEQATLRGHLLLAGLYKGDTEEGESEPLEHWIPVEITVPLNRVTSLEDIAVEIENFDVDLLSKRSLNITGVLSLKGIQAAVQEASDGAWNDEEITVVHAPDMPSEDHADFREADRQTAEPQAETGQAFGHQEAFDSGSATVQAAGYVFQPPADPAYPDEKPVPADGFNAAYGNNVEAAAPYGAYESVTELHRDPFAQAGQPADTDAVEEPFTVQAQSGSEPSNPNVWNFERAPETQNEEPVHESGIFPGIATERQDEEAPAHSSVPETSVIEPLETYAEAEALQEEVSAEETALQEEPLAKPELKVAFSSKNSTVNNTGGVGFSSLLQSSRTVQEQEAAIREEEEPKEETAEPAAAEDVQWKSLFLGGRQEDTPFRKVRLCIVQREETLEAIAERYQLSPRELLLYNRLSDQSVEEGQILYIP